MRKKRVNYMLHIENFTLKFIFYLFLNFSVCKLIKDAKIFTMLANC
jgi:hypothetical protein